MLRLTLELISNGDLNRKRTISVITIWNTGIKDIYDKYKYGFKGWLLGMDNTHTDIEEDEVFFDRQKNLYLLIYKVVKKVCEQLGYMKE